MTKMKSEYTGPDRRVSKDLGFGTIGNKGYFYSSIGWIPSTKTVVYRRFGDVMPAPIVKRKILELEERIRETNERIDKIQDGLFQFRWWRRRK